MQQKKSVCVIGAGPAGLSQLVQFSGHEAEIEVVCYEKQAEVGGQWHYDWRQGLDPYGEQVHSSMYRELMINAPKQNIEYPDYSYEDCFVKTEKKWWPDVGDMWKYTYCPREVMFIYMKQRVLHYNMYKNIQFKTIVKSVTKEANGMFKVSTLNQATGKIESRMFNFVIVSTGHYATPMLPNVPGFSDLRKTTVIHSHDFKAPQAYKGKRVLVVGGSYSAEDVCSMIWKFGVHHVSICSLEPMHPYKGWPSNVDVYQSNPLKECRVQHLENGETEESVVLKDGTILKDFDAIICCTGYKYQFPFIDNSIRLETRHMFVCDNLYQGTFLLQDPNVMYLGMQAQVLTLPWFDAQAYACKGHCLGTFKLPDTATMASSIKGWTDRCERDGDLLNKTLDCVWIQVDALKELAEKTGYYKREMLGKPVRVPDHQEMVNGFESWFVAKLTNIMTFRDAGAKDIYNGQTSALNPIKWKDFVVSKQPYAKI